MRWINDNAEGFVEMQKFLRLVQILSGALGKF